MKKILGLLNVVVNIAVYFVIACVAVFILLLLIYAAMYLAIAFCWLVIPIAIGALGLFIICIPVHIMNLPNYIRTLWYWLSGWGGLISYKIKEWYNFLEE